MVNEVIVRKNTYFDSVSLMSLGNRIKGMDGVDEAVVAMATEMNREILVNVGLATSDTQQAGPNDMVIAVRAESQEALDLALEAVEEQLNKKNDAAGGQAVVYKSQRHALADHTDANLAVISVPGQHAAREAMQALRNGLHVMIFSDNMSMEQELALKEYGRDHGLLVMGPDCGTAVINGTGLCFANKIRKGSIGVVGASGTGLQEVIVQIDRLGGGITQAIGTGGRDLKKEIGGIMMIEGVKALAQDPETKVIVVVSKPPEKSVEKKLFDVLQTLGKPVVACLIGNNEEKTVGNVQLCGSLAAAAAAAVSLTTPAAAISAPALSEEKRALARQAGKVLAEEQRFAAGLFCGGTLCAEALNYLRMTLGNVKSNISHEPGEFTEDVHETGCHLLLDLGDDKFTNGRPHPMIEPSLRDEYILMQARRQDVAVILLDFEIGYGSSPDPAGVAVPVIEQAQAIAAAQGRKPAFVGYICGTDKDKQGYAEQRRALEKIGVLVADSSIEAAQLVGAILGKE